MAEELTYLWDWFNDPVTGLHATRMSSGMGASRLSRLEIQAWERDEDVRLEDWERKAIMAIDRAWLESVIAQQKSSAAARDRASRT